MSKQKLREFPADPETRRKAIKDALDKEAGGDFTKKQRPTAPAKKRIKDEPKPRSDIRRLLDPKEKRERTVEGEPKTITEAVDKAVRGAKREY